MNEELGETFELPPEEGVAEEQSEEALEAERLQTVEYDYVEEELCPCIFIQYCEGVPLNADPDSIREQEADFHTEMLARKDELLAHDQGVSIENTEE